MFREIRTTEKITERDEKKEAWKNIKPTRCNTEEELKAFVEQAFMIAHNEEVGRIDITKRVHV
jgi:hypothetical protein